MQDGYNSVMRYVKNNFFDGDRQDSFDILTGAWVAKRGGIPPLTDTRPLLMRAVSCSSLAIRDLQADVQMPYILAFALSMVFCALTLPRTSGLSSPSSPPVSSRDSQLITILGLSVTSFLFVWFAMAIFSGTYIWGNVRSSCHTFPLRARANSIFRVSRMSRGPASTRPLRSCSIPVPGRTASSAEGE